MVGGHRQRLLPLESLYYLQTIVSDATLVTLIDSKADSLLSLFGLSYT